MHSGVHYYPGGELEDELSEGYNGFDLRFTWQARDTSNWSSVFNYANFGAGVFTGNIGDKNKLGRPIGVYGFINFPIYRAKRIEAFVGPALGMTFNLEPYNSVTNSENNVIGANIAAYFNASISANYALTRDIDLSLSGDFIHMSNGSAKQPNAGLDMFGGSIGVKWNFGRRQQLEGKALDLTTLYPNKTVRNKTRKSSFNIFQSIGRVQDQQDIGTDTTYTVLTTQFEYQYKFNEIHGISAGFNIFYDQSVENNPDYNVYNKNAFPALHFGYDFHFWRMYIRPQIGFIVSEAGQNLKSGFFMRLQLRADITNTLYTQIGVKTIHGMVADWADIGVGLMLFRR